MKGFENGWKEMHLKNIKAFSNFTDKITTQIKEWIKSETI